MFRAVCLYHIAWSEVLGGGPSTQQSLLRQAVF